MLSFLLLFVSFLFIYLNSFQGAQGQRGDMGLAGPPGNNGQGGVNGQRGIDGR